MKNATFDTLARSLNGPPTRRAILRGLATVLGLSLTATLGPGAVMAKKKRKQRKKPKKNEFGCLDVGKACNGKDRKCCSGICQGKRPRKGEKDKTKCKAHDTGGCEGGQVSDVCGAGTLAPCTSSSGDEGGICETTTGKAGYCMAHGECFPCQRDADCVPFCGPEAACVTCTFCPAEGNTLCARPVQEGCDFTSARVRSTSSAPIVR